MYLKQLAKGKIQSRMLAVLSLGCMFLVLVSGAYADETYYYRTEIKDSGSGPERIITLVTDGLNQRQLDMKPTIEDGTTLSDYSGNVITLYGKLKHTDFIGKGSCVEVTCQSTGTNCEALSADPSNCNIGGGTGCGSIDASDPEQVSRCNVRAVRIETAASVELAHIE